MLYDPSFEPYRPTKTYAVAPSYHDVIEEEVYPSRPPSPPRSAASVSRRIQQEKAANVKPHNINDPRGLEKILPRRSKCAFTVAEIKEHDQKVMELRRAHAQFVAEQAANGIYINPNLYEYTQEQEDIAIARNRILTPAPVQQYPDYTPVYDAPPVDYYPQYSDYPPQYDSYGGYPPYGQHPYPPPPVGEQGAKKEGIKEKLKGMFSQKKKESVPKGMDQGYPPYGDQYGGYGPSEYAEADYYGGYPPAERAYWAPEHGYDRPSYGYTEGTYGRQPYYSQDPRRTPHGWQDRGY